MKQQFTKEDLVRDIYGESSYLEKMAIQKAKENDSEVKEDYKSLKKAKNLLDSVDIQPPSFIVQNILDYSKSSEFEAEAG